VRSPNHAKSLEKHNADRGPRPPKCDAIINAGVSHIVKVLNDAEYNASVSSYWAANSQLQPYCILQPQNTDDVAAAMKALSETSAAGNWDVAIRGGGQSSWASNNVAQGVTFDLSLLDSTSWSACDDSPFKSLCSSGPATDVGQLFNLPSSTLSTDLTFRVGRLVNR
jgi:hypothetical protein